MAYAHDMSLTKDERELAWWRGGGLAGGGDDDDRKKKTRRGRLTITMPQMLPLGGSSN
jgi:hypothetical protein